MSKEKLAQKQEKKRVSQFHLMEHFLSAGYNSVFSSDLPQGWVAYASGRSKMVLGQEIKRYYVVDRDGLVGWSHVPRNGEYETDPLQSAIVNLQDRQVRFSAIKDAEGRARYIRRKQGKCIESVSRQRR